MLIKAQIEAVLLLILPPLSVVFISLNYSFFFVCVHLWHLLLVMFAT